MKKEIKPSGYWDIKENCRQSTLECRTKTEWHDKFGAAQQSAKKHGWLEELTLPFLLNSESYKFNQEHKIHKLDDGSWTGFVFCLGCKRCREKHSATYKCIKRNIHKFEEDIESRCSFCHNLQVDETNCLTTTHYELAKLISPTKEFPLSADEITFYSHKKVNWICVNGHHRQTQPQYIGKCKKCSFHGTSNIEIKFFYHIHSVFPKSLHLHKIDGKEIDIQLVARNIVIGIEFNASQYHVGEENEKGDKEKFEFLKNKVSDFIIIKSKNINIICSNEFIYNYHTHNIKEVLMGIFSVAEKYIIFSEEQKNKMEELENTDFNLYQYPADIFKKPPVENSLAVVFPEIAKEWDYEKNGNFKPEYFSPYSVQHVWWKDPDCGCPYLAQISNRTSCDSGSPYTHGQKVCHHNSLRTLKPELASEWNYDKNENLTPCDLTANSHIKVWWKCKDCSHEWQQSPNANSKCPYCHKRKWSKDEDDYLICLCQKYGSSGLKSILEELNKKYKRTYSSMRHRIDGFKKQGVIS